MRVVGIDPSTSATGIARVDGSTFTYRPNADASNIARRLHQIVGTVEFCTRIAGAELVMIEGYSLGGLRGLAAARLAELGGCIRLRLFENDIPYVEIPPRMLKKFATGKGNADKTEMIKAALDAGADVGPTDHDAAEAWFLRGMACSWYEPTVLEPHQVDILKSIKWPEQLGGPA